MWGNISTESTYLTNFNLGFSNNSSDVLIHLSQWQYWWWFWFAFVWVLYYLIIARTVRHRLLKFRPRIVTSFRPHGKWGDLLTCLIPISWCVNILINSNFILKMVEWQNESSLFTIRIRGRQWYWVYKYELKVFTDILSAPKNVGRNHWQLNTPGDLQIADDYLRILQLRSQNTWVKQYWNDVLKRNAKTDKTHVLSQQEQFKFNHSLYNNKIILESKLNNLDTEYNNLNFLNNEYFEFIDKNFFYKNINNSYLNYILRIKLLKKNWSMNSHSELNTNFFINNVDEPNNFFLNNFFNYSASQNSLMGKKWWFEEIYKMNTNDNNVLRFGDYLENTRNVKRAYGTNSPIRFIKNTFINNKNMASSFDKTNIEDTYTLFRVRFNDSNNNLVTKLPTSSIYLCMKQKKYAYQKNIRYKSRMVWDMDHTKKENAKWSSYLYDNKQIVPNTDDATRQYRMVKKNKMRQEVFPVHLNRRLLRTKKTLVLPAHVNITAITNSYDVVHSWFIPGLGLKMDCIPGRATHHTFFVDNVGFYYGQCAEICGRYHHHMPIRICALPFEHFLVWWHSFGLPKLLFTNKQKKFSLTYGLRKYVW